MPKFKVSVPHSLSPSEASDRIRQQSEAARSSTPEVSNVEEKWDENGNLYFSFSAMGFTIKGEMLSQSEEVLVNGEIPFAALPFRGMIEQQIAKRIGDALQG